MLAKKNVYKRLLPIFTAFAFFLASLYLSILLSSYLSQQEKNIQQNKTTENLSQIKFSVFNAINSTLTSLKRMADRWEHQQGTPKPQWSNDAKNYIRDFDGLSTLQWIDKSYHIRWVEPLADNEKAIGLYMTIDQKHEQSLLESIKKNTINITPPVNHLQGYKAFISYIPVYIDKELDGFIVGIFNIDKLFQYKFSKEHRQNFDTWILDENELVYATTTKTLDLYIQSLVGSSLAQVSKINFYNRQWTIIINPKSKPIDNQYKNITSSKLVLLLGLIFSIVLGLAIYLAIITFVRNKMLIKNSVEIKNTNERYRSILESNDVGILSIDNQGYIERVNPQCAIMYGYSAKELIGKHFNVLLPNQHHQEINRFIQRFCENDYLDKSYSRIELEGLAKEGTVFPCELSASEIIIDNIKKLNFIIFDTTERVKEEQILNEIYKITVSGEFSFEDKLSKVLESGREYFGLSMGIISKIEGNKYEIVKVSPNGSMQKGTQFDLGNTYCAHTYRTREVNAWHNAGLSEIAEHPCYKGFGLETYIGTTIIVNDKPYGTVNFTDKVKRNEPFSKRQKAFINVIAQWLGAEIYRNQSLADKEKFIEKLHDSNEELERFAYVCSHDLQEPLRSVKGFTELLEKRLESTLLEDETTKKYFSFVAEGAKRAQELIKDILSYSKLDHDTEKRQVINMNELVESLKNNMEANLQECGGIISADKLPNIVGNKTQIYQLLQNLINNGLKYRKPNEKPHVHLSAIETEEFWEFSVSDNGIGMKEEHLPKIFEVFQRLHHKREYAGTGIGLSICKKIVARHNGDIWVRSKQGSGSTFTFRLFKV